jgi:hypothetical protein
MKEEFTNCKERDAKSFQSIGFSEGRNSIFIADRSRPLARVYHIAGMQAVLHTGPSMASKRGSSKPATRISEASSSGRPE